MPWAYFFINNRSIYEKMRMGGMKVAATKNLDDDLINLLCSWVSGGNLGYLEGLGLSCEDIKALKFINDNGVKCSRTKSRIFENITVNRSAISELVKGAELDQLLVEMIINGANYEMASAYFGVQRRSFYGLRNIHSDSIKYWKCCGVSRDSVKGVCYEVKRGFGNGSCLKVQVLSMLEVSRKLQCPLREVWSVISKAQAKGEFSWEANE